MAADPGLIAGAVSAASEMLGKQVEFYGELFFGKKRRDEAIMANRVNPYKIQVARDSTMIYFVGGALLLMIIVSILFFTTIKKS